jgi:hypothetical protein
MYKSLHLWLKLPVAEEALQARNECLPMVRNSI